MTDQHQWDWDADPVAPGAVVAPVQRPLSSPAKRLGAALLEIVLAIVTLYVGWFVWSMVVWKDGTTPAKQILGMQVVEAYDGRVANWGTMLLREFIAKTICGFIAILTLGVLYFMPFWDKNRQGLWDKLAGTYVVDR